jgi:hypothetical protein
MGRPHVAGERGQSRGSAAWSVTLGSVHPVGLAPWTLRI